MANKILRIALIAMFCVFIGAFGLMYALLPKSDFSEKEKRALSSFPEASVESILDGSFESGIETWMSDHVPGRDMLVGLNARYDLVSGRNGLRGVLFAGGNRLIASAEKLNEASIISKFSRVNTFADAAGIPVDMMLVPTSGFIHEDELPLHAPYPDAALMKLAIENAGNVRLIWPGERFRRMDDIPLYYNTDHHLTSRGSYELCSLYAENTGARMPGADNYDVETVGGFYGSMYAKAGLWDVAPDNVELWRSRSLGDVTVTFDDREPADSLFFTEHLSEMDKYPVFLDGNHGLVVIETGREGGENLLIIRDSFGHCFAPFAADLFDRVVLVDLRYFRKPVSELAAEMEIDRALVLYGVDTFITDTNFGWLK